MKKFLLIVFLFISSCGYKPIYLINNQSNLEFDKIILEGDEKINKVLINKLNLKENLSVKKSLTLSSNYIITETSKNSKGQIETYKSVIQIKLTITANNKVLHKRVFSSEFNYNNKSSKYELSNYQNEIRDNLIIELIEEIILFLNLI